MKKIIVSEKIREKILDTFDWKNRKKLSVISNRDGKKHYYWVIALPHSKYYDGSVEATDGFGLICKERKRKRLTCIDCPVHLAWGYDCITKPIPWILRKHKEKKAWYDDCCGLGMYWHYVSRKKVKKQFDLIRKELENLICTDVKRKTHKTGKKFKRTK